MRLKIVISMLCGLVVLGNAGILMASNSYQTSSFACTPGSGTFKMGTTGANYCEDAADCTVQKCMDKIAEYCPGLVCSMIPGEPRDCVLNEETGFNECWCRMECSEPPK